MVPEESDKVSCFLLGALITDAIGDTEWASGEMSQNDPMTAGYKEAEKIYMASVDKILKGLADSVDNCGQPKKLEEIRNSMRDAFASRDPDRVSQIADKLDSVLGRAWNQAYQY